MSNTRQRESHSEPPPPPSLPSARAPSLRALSLSPRSLSLSCSFSFLALSLSLSRSLSLPRSLSRSPFFYSSLPFSLCLALSFSLSRSRSLFLALVLFSLSFPFSPSRSPCPSLSGPPRTRKHETASRWRKTTPTWAPLPPDCKRCDGHTVNKQACSEEEETKRSKQARAHPHRLEHTLSLTHALTHSLPQRTHTTSTNARHPTYHLGGGGALLLGPCAGLGCACLVARGQHTSATKAKRGRTMGMWGEREDVLATLQLEHLVATPHPPRKLGRCARRQEASLRDSGRRGDVATALTLIDDTLSSSSWCP